MVPDPPPRSVNKCRRMAPQPTPLTWVGGKSRVLPQMLPILRDAGWFQPGYTLVEPFAGSAALTFYLLASQGDPTPKNVILMDAVLPLLDFYRYLPEIAPYLSQMHADLQQAQSTDLPVLDRQTYEKFRTVLNSHPDPIQRAAAFLVCNWSGYNGLWRTNREGKSNVPWGQWTLQNDWPTLLQQAQQSARHLQQPHLTLHRWDARAPASDPTTPLLPEFPFSSCIYVDSPYPGTYSGYHHPWTDEDFRTLKTHLCHWAELGHRVAVAFPEDHLHLLPKWTVHHLSVPNLVGHTASSRNTRSEVLVLSP